MLRSSPTLSSIFCWKRFPFASSSYWWDWGSSIIAKLIILPDRVQDPVNLTRRIVSRIDSDPIILSHHPLCGRFDDHVFKIRGRYVCIGCATVYPSALVTALLLLIMSPISFSIIFPISLSFFAMNLMRLLTKNHRFSILFNACLGISLGAALFSAIYAPEGLQLAVVIAGLAVVISFSFLKGRRVFATCKSCQRYREFPSCCGPVVLKMDESQSVRSE